MIYTSPKLKSHSLLIYVNIAMHWFVYPPHLCFHLAQIYWPTNSVRGRHGDKQSAGYWYTHDLRCQAAAAGYSSSILITAGCSQVEPKIYTSSSGALLMEMIVWGPETELVHTRLDKYHKGPGFTAATAQTEWVGSTWIQWLLCDDNFYMEFQWFP